MSEFLTLCSMRRVGGALKNFIPGPIGWSVEDRSRSRRKFVWIFAGLVASAIAVALLGLLMVLRPESGKSLWLLQFGSIVALFGLIGAALACARRCFFDPLAHVRDWASAIRQGNFAARVPTTVNNDYAELAEDINRLAEWLESLAHDRDTESRRQTEWLSQKTRSLQLLYDVASGINASTRIEELLGQFLYALQDVFGAYGGIAFLRAPDGAMRRVASAGLESISNTDSARVSSVTRVDAARLGSDTLPDGVFAITIPLQYKNDVLGEYELFVDARNRQLSSETADMLTSIGRQLGIAVRKSKLEQDATRLSRMEERTRLANELHDSLSQTLASLKFQVRVLDDTLHQGDESAIWQCMEQVESSLDEAYAELRELITHFRAPIDKRGIVSAIEVTLSRFRKETDIPIFFQNQWKEVNLSPERGIQVVRIIQESLNNCRKHSQASAVRVLLSTLVDGSHRVLVEDDGAGFDEATASAGADVHLGLSIMHERAANMDAELRIESEPGDGTRVVLQFSDPRSPGAAEQRSVA